MSTIWLPKSVLLWNGSINNRLTFQRWQEILNYRKYIKMHMQTAIMANITYNGIYPKYQSIRITPTTTPHELIENGHTVDRYSLTHQWYISAASAQSVSVSVKKCCFWARLTHSLTSGAVPCFDSQWQLRLRDVKLYTIATDIFFYIVFRGRWTSAVSVSKMNDERLIVLVRNHPVLYDLSEPKYMDSGLKQRIWKNIGQELKVDSKYSSYIHFSVTMSNM